MQTNNLNNKAIYWEQIAKNPSKLRLLRSPSSPLEGTTTATTTTTNSSWGIPFNQSLRHPSQQSLPVLAEQCFWPCIIEDFGAVFERQLEINNTGYLVGDKITWIDFYAASFSDLALTYGREDMLDRFPRVLHHCRAVHSLPQLQQHIKTRPDTLF
uniref:GST C-terminal domain-containing protein n=1 Tax=Meloidogyne floridensis TaxID=298350 RepID=A0A915NQE0_9BILA